MRRLLLLILLSLTAVAAAADKDAKGRKAAKDEDIGGGKKKTEIVPEKSLAGDVTRKKKTEEVVPALQYDQFRLGVESQISDKRRRQIQDLEKLLELTPNDKVETPKLLFRVGELYWEESKAFFFEANRKDDYFIRAQAAKDKAGMERAKAEKEEWLAKSKEQAKIAVEKYSKIVQEWKEFPRTDEVLYFLGQNLMESGDEKRGLIAYKRLIEKYPKSKYLPDAYLAFGEYYFNNSKGKHDQLEKALENYKNAAKYPDSTAYGYALYKQGWCYFNMSDYEKAMDQFRAVVLYGKLVGDKDVEQGKGNKKGLVKEARNDYVRAYERMNDSTPADGRERFSKLVETPDELRDLMKKLANLYYDDGKDKEAALGFNMLIRERPTSPESPGFQGKIIDCVMRAGNKQQTINQVHQLVKITHDVDKANPKCKDDSKCVSQLKEAAELSERTLSNLAVNWHNEGKKTRDDQTFKFANEVYADYLTLYPDNPKAYDLRFFWAELLNDQLNDYAKSAEQYTLTFQVDIKRIDKCTNGAQQPEAKEGEGENKDDAQPAEEAKDDKSDKGDKKKKKGGLCRWMKNSAYNAILANQEVVKAWEADAKNKPPAVSDPTKSVEIPPVKKALIEACERYLKYIPNPDKKVEIAYKVAKIYYDYNHLDEAVPRLSDIALKYPDYKFENGDKVGVISANLVLDSYNLLGDWAKVNEWARKFFNVDKLFVGKDRDELAKLIEQSAFKLVNQYEARKEYAKAADAYIGFVTEFPRSALADQALYNASIDYFNAHMLDKAIEQRKALIEKYPKSKFVPQTLYALAEGYDATAEFPEASNYYESYFSHYEKANGCGKKGPAAKHAAAPKKAKKGKGDKDDDKDEGPKGEQVWEEGKAQIALYNAGIFRDGLGDYGKALRNREKYLECWGEAKGMEADAEKVFLSIVDLHEKNNAWAKAQKQLEEHEKKYCAKDPNKLLGDEGRIASIYEDKLHNPKGAAKIYERILDYYEKLNKKQKAGLEIAALDAVGRAHYLHNEPEWKKFLGVKLKWSKLINVGELKNSIKEKAKALDGIQKLYTVTVGFKSAEPAICALNRIGDAYENFAEQLNNPPIPKGMPDDLKEEFLLQMKQQITDTGLVQHATEAYVASVQKSTELDVYNQCTIKALEKLRTKYKPEAYPKMGEEVLDIKVDGKGTLAIGNDIVNAIQALPTTPRDSAAEKAVAANTKEVGKQVDKQVGKQVADYDPNNPPKDDPPPKREEKKDAPAPKQAPPNKGDAEPSDEPL